MTKQEQLIIILLIVSALIGTGLLYQRKFHEPEVKPEVVDAAEAMAPKEIVADVKGACWRPGVYTLPYGARVKELIELACPREDASLEGINLARRLKDGEGIFIPRAASRADAGTEAPAGSALSNAAGEGKLLEKININIAGPEELEKLPGIGPRLAGYIVEHRRSRGPFKKIDDIKNVDNIGEETFKKIKGLITVE